MEKWGVTTTTTVISRAGCSLWGGSGSIGLDWSKEARPTTVKTSEYIQSCPGKLRCVCKSCLCRNLKEEWGTHVPSWGCYRNDKCCEVVRYETRSTEQCHEKKQSVCLPGVSHGQGVQLHQSNNQACLPFCLAEEEGGDLAQPGLSFPGPAEEDIGKVTDRGGGAMTAQSPTHFVTPIAGKLTLNLPCTSGLRDGTSEK